MKLYLHEVSSRGIAIEWLPTLPNGAPPFQKAEELVGAVVACQYTRAAVRRGRGEDERIISRRTIDVSSSLTMSTENWAELLKGRSNG